MLIREPITTARLILRPERPEDADAVHAMNCDPHVMHYIGGGAWTSAASEFREQYRRALERNVEKPWGGVIVTDRPTGEFLGLCWLAPSEFLGGRIELGYRYIPAAWGRGLATEAAERVVRVGFEDLQMEAIGSTSHPGNVASIRVLEKLGFRKLQDRFHPKAECDVHVYELTAAEWEARAG